YSVILTVTDNNGCTDVLTRNNYIAVHKPQAAFSANLSSICAGDPVHFTSTSTVRAMPITHRWDFGDNTTDTGFRPIHRYKDTGNFRVRLIVTDAVGCSDTFI